MFGIGAGEFVVILIVGLIVFGPSKLPEVGRALGKVLREFRKAQAALTETLNDVEEPLKNSATVKKSAPEKISAAGSSNAPQGDSPPQEKNSTPEKVSTEKNSPAMTADDVINLTKERSLVKENSDEKNFNGNSNDAPAGDAGARLAGAGSGSNGTDKQSGSAAH